MTTTQVQQAPSRVTSLDYVRGLAALGILLYHFQSWTLGHMAAESFWGRIGLYGVAIFYVLSGLTLYHVYEARMQPQKVPLADFYLKRIFRLFPLLWLIMPVYLIIDPTMREWDRVLLNFIGLFGFVAWDKPIGTGVWSIGNELVFYLFFPIFLFSAKYSRAAFAFVCLVILTIGVYFAFYSIDDAVPLATQWRDYVNPLNQIFLFLGGVAIGYFAKYKSLPSLPLVLLLLAGIAVFILYPVSGNTVTLVTDWNRFIFAGTCLAICFAMYKLPITLPKLLHVPLHTLGEISYALYLLHPLVYKVVQFAAKQLHFSPWVTIILAMVATLILSQLVYRYYEQRFVRLGQKASAAVTSRLIK
ncbi:acyltransferase [Pontibacter sp. KCTC 32443]|uniref:acyltransferase family protein n=1 Tax=Pontibacter TaxID=323449 RepID=UPI00164E7120|nr:MULTISPECIES: acyltransferase [Pontibacter]MBC5775257.1 acyltransferase [Pontibacter sp. KCTC 32443]